MRELINFQAFIRPARFVLMIFALAGVVQPVSANDYVVDRQESLILIHVSRAGIARALGHNHLISTRQVTGSASYVASELPRSQLKLRMPVNALVVDDPALRREHGDRYEKPVSASAREGTRSNMLGEKVLDAARFNEIMVRGRWHSGTADKGQLIVTISLHGVAREMLVPVRVENTAANLTASGKFLLRQSDFGVKPFTALGGTLAVGDTIEIEYKIVLTPAKNPE